MEKRLGNLNPALHSAGELLHAISQAATKAHSANGAVNAGPQVFSAEAIQVALVVEVFVRGEFFINAGRLEHNAQVRANKVRLRLHVVAHNAGGAGAGLHLRGEDLKEGGFTTAVWPQQCENFGMPHGEAYFVQGLPVTIAVRN